MPRQARLDAPGTLHHVIIRGIEQRSIVEDREDREEFVSRMGQIATETGTVIYAWSLMTNHAHILVRSAQRGLAEYMRRVLTGYAIAYNRRHRRYGHLFQNRYKSIVCDEDVYFCELVRYIHLNPVRVRLVKDISELGRYPWSGHRALMGREHNAWQACAYVLSWFGKQEATARRARKNEGDVVENFHFNGSRLTAMTNFAPNNTVISRYAYTEGLRGQVFD
jgi:putative transposase